MELISSSVIFVVTPGDSCALSALALLREEVKMRKKIQGRVGENWSAIKGLSIQDVSEFVNTRKVYRYEFAMIGIERFVDKYRIIIEELKGKTCK